MKKILTFLLMLATLLSLVACNSNTDTSNTKDDSTGMNGHIQTSSTENEPTTTAPNETQKPPEEQFKEDEALFIAAGRDDDHEDKLFAYNYKGDLLKASANMWEIYSLIGWELFPYESSVTDKWGYVDQFGVFQIDSLYEMAWPFSDAGIALVEMKIEKDGQSDYKYGYINTKGETVVPFKYDYATSFYNNGYALAYTAEYNHIEHEKTYNGITYPWTETICIAETQYIIDQTGKEVVAIDVFEESRSLVAVFENYYVCSVNIGTENERLAVFDFSGKKILEEEYSENIQFSLQTEQLQKHIFENGIYLKSEYLIDGKFVENKKSYQISSKQVVSTQSGVGYGITRDGVTLVPFQYDQILQVGNYFIAIRLTGDSYYEMTLDIYDQNFKKTAENLPYYFNHSYNIDPYGYRSSLPDGYFQIWRDRGELSGIIDYTGKIIVPPIYFEGLSPITYERSGNFEWVQELPRID